MRSKLWPKYPYVIISTSVADSVRCDVSFVNARDKKDKSSMLNRYVYIICNLLNKVSLVALTCVIAVTWFRASSEILVIIAMMFLRLSARLSVRLSL